MIEITSLKLNKEGTKLIISAQETSGGYLKSILIDTQKTFICTNEPSTSAIQVVIDRTDTEHIELDDQDHIIKIIDYEVDLTSDTMLVIDVKNDMLFVFVEGVVIIDGEKTPQYVAGVVFDQSTFYNLIFKKIHSSIIHNNCCDIPAGAENIALLYEAFQLSWFTADPRKFIFYWNELHNNITNTESCNCHG